LEEAQIFWVLWDLGFYQICFSSVPGNFLHHHMTYGAVRRLVPDVIDLYSQTKSKQKVTISNGGKWKWDENLSCSPHPTEESNAARADSLRGRVG
jgi:hypothetical protein